jgi:hypothetical protein
LTLDNGCWLPPTTHHCSHLLWQWQPHNWQYSNNTLLTTTSSRAAAAAAAAGFDTQTPIFPPFINPTKTQEGDFALYLRKGLTVYLIFSHQFCFWIIGFLWDLGKNVFFDGSESLISQPKNGIFFLL